MGGKRKRRPGGGFDDRASDDSDFDDLRARGGRPGGAGGGSAKSVRVSSWLKRCCLQFLCRLCLLALESRLVRFLLNQA